MSESAATDWPLNPSARQKGNSYTTVILMIDPDGMRCVSSVRAEGNCGSYCR